MRTSTPNRSFLNRNKTSTLKLTQPIPTRRTLNHSATPGKATLHPLRSQFSVGFIAVMVPKFSTAARADSEILRRKLKRRRVAQISFFSRSGFSNEGTSTLFSREDYPITPANTRKNSTGVAIRRVAHIYPSSSPTGAPHLVLFEMWVQRWKQRPHFPS
jgi:hypothetical protein